MRAGYIPAAPALAQRASMIGDECAHMKQRHAQPIRIDRAHQQPRHTQGAARGVTLQALIPPEDLWRCRPLLVQRVENYSLAGIDGSDLHYIATPYPPHRDMVVEIERARHPRKDAGRLKAGLREYEHL